MKIANLKLSAPSLALTVLSSLSIAQGAPVTYAVTDVTISATFNSFATNVSFQLNGPDVHLTGGNSSFPGPVVGPAGANLPLVINFSGDNGFGGALGNVGGTIYNGTSSQLLLTGGTVFASGTIPGGNNPTVTGLTGQLTGDIRGCSSETSCNEFVLAFAQPAVHGFASFSGPQSTGSGVFYTLGSATLTTTPEPRSAWLAGTALMGAALLALARRGASYFAALRKRIVRA